MKFAKRNLLAIAMMGALALTPTMGAQDNPAHPAQHHQYKLYDLGTFGGPDSYPSFGAVTVARGGAVGGADTSVPDPFSPNCFEPECLVLHAFQWRNGLLTDLGALPGNNGENSSYAFAINNSGFVVGVSETGAMDPSNGYPVVHPVVWQNGEIVDLGTFGGSQGAAEMVNDRGQVVGVATNDVPDPFSFGHPFPATTQSRAFVWEGGVKQDLGTLGGPDAFAAVNNQSGQVVGWSYSNNSPNPDSGVPTIDPFLWTNGRMIDLGGFGGDLGYAQWINNKGQVVGYSYLPGDQAFHAFLWDKGGLTDLGTLGGSISGAFWINDAGDAVGGSYLPGDQNFDPVLWRHGTMTDLGHLPACQGAGGLSINSRGQIVGENYGCTGSSAFLGYIWENGGPMVDLNSLVQPGSNIVVAYPLDIDDSGQIAAQGVLPNGDTHVVLLVPSGDCDASCEQRILQSQNSRPPVQAANAGATAREFSHSGMSLRTLGRRAPGAVPIR